ncbi:hypothetical protein BGX38DRAFT_1175825 [Terfezia claveryi]|nr:hypothetical protein BGX38DRAFT_1175825 [Terfezia claveryi]
MSTKLLTCVQNVSEGMRKREYSGETFRHSCFRVSHCNPVPVSRSRPFNHWCM